MTMPMEYQHAAADFDRLLVAVMERTGLATRNQAYTVMEGVLRTFRRRLAVADGLRFAGALPPLLRALFVSEWDVAEPPREFSGRAAMTEEVKALRRDHNFAPDSAIADVAAALRASLDAAQLREFERVLASLPPPATAYWRAPADD